ncbi:hypothetical protein M9H77_29486 [Catharanthus roseus]|uniref:Uncharacterized protein n=1 Tax=Catharanthus roseus TaxID=4058 RepID=A0ACB9ZUV9_CATRO|nr:hypothetical protein M9H77_29486 [Catharanthus roseus]
MITGYMQNLRCSEAFYLFGRMPEKDASSWNTMITGCIHNGDLRTARRIFNEMPKKNVISWTTMINGYAQDKQGEDALGIFLSMLRDSTEKPNEGTFVSVLGACSDLAGLVEGKQIHQVICKTIYQKSDFVKSALISMYSKCGEFLAARKVFDDGVRGQKDLVYWNSMIAACAHHGCGREAIELFEEMRNMGLKPNDVTYLGLLTACSHAGLLEEGFKYFDMLVSDRSTRLREDHYTCLIDLYSRAGRFKEALDFIEQLPVKLSVISWGAILAGCNVHGNANIVKLVADKILEAEPEDPRSYTMLSSMYAHSERWNEAAKLRTIMNSQGLKKQPGCSWIDVLNQVHVFVAGDDSHSQGALIYSLLGTLHRKMKAASQIFTDSNMMEEDLPMQARVAVSSICRSHKRGNASNLYALICGPTFDIGASLFHSPLYITVSMDFSEIEELKAMAANSLPALLSLFI